MTQDKRPTLNIGFEVIVFQALRTSTFLSLFAVLGNLDPAHEITVPRLWSELFLKAGGANGDAPASAICCTNSDFVLGHCVLLWEVASELGLPTPEDSGVPAREID